MQGGQQSNDAMDFEAPKTGGFNSKADELTIARIPPGGLMGFSEDQLYRRKALQDIINDPATDRSTLRNAQKQWIMMQQQVRGV